MPSTAISPASDTKAARRPAARRNRGADEDAMDSTRSGPPVMDLANNRFRGNFMSTNATTRRILAKFCYPAQSVSVMVSETPHRQFWHGSQAHPLVLG